MEQVDDYVRLTWEKTAGAHTYTIYYAEADSVNTAWPQHILATGVRGTAWYLPVDTTREAGLSFCITANNRYHIESAPPGKSIIIFLLILNNKNKSIFLKLSRFD